MAHGDLERAPDARVEVPKSESGLVTALLFVPRTIGKVLSLPQNLSDRVIGKTGLLGRVAHFLTNPLIVTTALAGTTLAIGQNRGWWNDFKPFGVDVGTGLNVGGQMANDAAGHIASVPGHIGTGAQWVGQRFGDAAEAVGLGRTPISSGARQFAEYARGPAQPAS